MTENLLVSIIVPAYNAAKHIKGAIGSVLGQTYENIEIIVVDDGSKDRTAEIVKSFTEKRVKYIYQENKGVAGARNTGLKEAGGEYLAFLDADDFYLPEKIEKQVEFLKNNPEFDLAYCNMRHFYEEKPDVLYQYKGTFYSGDIFEKTLQGFFAQLNTVLIPKKVFASAGFFDETSRHSEEWDLFLRISRAGFKIGFLNLPLVKIRMSQASLSNFKNQWAMKKHNLDVFQRIFNSMMNEERKKYQADKILKKLKIKLAAAYLAVGQKKDFNKTVISASSNFFERIVFYFLIFFIFLIPASVLSFITVRFWQIKQRRLYQRVSS